MPNPQRGKARMGELDKWLKQDWVRIDSSGNIAGECGTSKDKKNPDRCLPRAKASSLSRQERQATAKKKKQSKQTYVKNTKKAEVNFAYGGEVSLPKPKRKFNGKVIPGTAVARGCGTVMANRRKRTKGSVTQS